MTDTNITGNQTTALTLKDGNNGVDDTLTVGASGQLKTTATAVVMNLTAAPAGAGVVLTNNGTIQSTGDRTLDTTGAAAGSKITLNNNGSIISSGPSKADVFRIADDIVNGVITVNNTGTIQSTGQTNDSQGLRFGKSYNSTITINNSATGKILTANADAIRAGNNSTITNYGTITANASSVPSAKNPANAIDISVAQSSTVINHGGTITGAGSGLGTDVGNNSPSGATTAPNYNVTNDQGGVIIGQVAAGIASGGTATIVNSGTIQGLGLSSLPGGATATAYDGDGVNITGVATITNTGTIQGVRSAGVSAVTGRNNISEGVVIGGGVVTNSGTIEGGYAGVTVDNVQNTNQTRSGSVALNLTNQAGGVIKGDNGYAIRSENKTADGSANAALTNDTITNYGTIIGNGAIPSGTVNLGTGAADPNTVGTLDGVTYTSAGNAGSARFILGDGSAIQTGEGDDVVNNYGSIVGNSGRAINLEGGADTLNLFAGQSIIGRIDGGAGNDTITLNVGASASTGTLANVVNVENLNVKGGSWTLSDAQSYSNGVKIAAGATLTLGAAGSLGGAIVDNGSLASSNAGAVTISEAVTGTGSITQSGTGVLTLSGANSYSGGTALNAGALDVASATGAGSGAITFGAGAQTLDIELGALTGSGSTAQFGNTLAGFGVGDAIDLRGVGAATSASYDASTGQLTIAGGSTTVVLTLDASSAPAAGFAFGVTSDGAGGTAVALDRIATVGSVSAASATPYVKAGDSFTISIAMDKPVTISGDAPSLTLSDGGVAVYDAANSTPTNLVFVATVAAGQNANGVSITGVVNSGSVIDAAHVPADLAAAQNLAPVGPTVDTVAPTVSIDNSGGLTNKPEQTITGVSSEGGVTVALYEGATEIGRTTADANGAWSVDVTLSGNGDHAVRAVATDSAGNAGSSQNVLFDLDTVAPTVTVATTPQLTNNPSLTVSGSVDVTANADAIGTTVSVYDGATVVGTAVVQQDGSWSASVNLSGDGQHTLKASDTDLADNTGYSAPFTVVLDTQAPETGVTTHPAPVTSATDASFAFSGVDAAGGSGVNGYLYSVDGGGFVATDQPAVTLGGLADGVHSIVVKAVDAAGNADLSPATYSWRVDTTAPDTVLTGQPAKISNSASAQFGLSGTDPDGSGVTSFLVSLDGGAFVSTTLDKAQFSGLSEGAHKIAVKAVDGAGNIDASPATYGWTVDTIAPDTTVSGQPAKVTNATSAHFGLGGIDGAGSGVAGFLASVDGGAFQAVDGSSIDLSGLSQGKHSVAVKAVDKAGNVDATPATYSWTVDTTAAQVAFTSAGGVVHTGQQVISGTVDASEAGRIVTIRDGSNVIGTAKVSSDGRFATSVVLSGDGQHKITASETDEAGNTGTSGALDLDLDRSAPTFVKGNLVLSVYGDGDGSGEYGDNEATPITLQQFSTTGEFISQIVLPQSTIGSNSVVSGELGSSSEGSLQLTGDGRALLIAGYGINALEYNDGGAAVYGDDALAQTTSLTGQANFIPVSRVIAVISPDGSVDSSTTLFNIFDGNNPRSVASLDGHVFYISGQGQAGDKTQGVFVTQLGSSSATAIDNSTDTRTAVIYDGQLYISRDSKQPKVGSVQGTANISVFSTLPTGKQTPTVLTGINRSVTLGAGQTNTINHAGQTVNLDPENFFFADSKTLYVADGGISKIGGVGDGGLQKWTLGSSGQWELQYTLSEGLGIVGQGSAYGTTGLICLTGRVVGDTVELYATNQTVGDLDQKYLFGITDHISDKTGAGKSFTTLVTAAEGTNIRGLSFAPTTDAPTIDFDNEGGLTNQPKLVLSGSVDLADAGTTVVIKDGSKTLGSALVAIDGSWTTTVTLTGEGAHTLTASDTDIYGNTGKQTISFTLDTVAPDIAVTTAGGPTRVARQTISGTGEAGATVTLYEGSDEIATAVVDQNGKWSAKVTLGGEGVHAIAAKATDAAGNVGTGGSISFTLDTTAPGAPTIALLNDTGSSKTDRITSDARLDVTPAEAGDTLLYRVDGAATFTEGAPVITGDGRHTVDVRERDAAGNLGAATRLLFTLDTTAPGAPKVALANDTGVSKSDRITSDAHLLATPAEAGDTLLYRVDGAASFTTGAPAIKGDGQHTVEVRERDAAGNLGASSTLVFTLDTVAPALALSTSGGLTRATRQTISGTGEAGATVTLFEGGAAIGKAVVSQAGTWNVSVALKGDGAHAITAKAADAAGNVRDGGAITFMLDTTAPGAPTIALRNDTGSSQTDRITSDARLLVTPAEAGDTLLYRVDGAASFTAGAPSITADGRHTVDVRERDAAGNLGGATRLVFTLDTKAPAVAISNAGGTISASRQTISGSGEAGTSVEIFDGSTSLGTVKVGDNGAWKRSVDITGAGKHVVTARNTDRAGNIGVSKSVTFTVPAASSLNALVQAMSTTGSSAAGALSASAPSTTSQEHALAAAHG